LVQDEVKPVPALRIRAAAYSRAGPFASSPRIDPQLAPNHDAGGQIIGIAQEQHRLVRIVQSRIELPQAAISDLPLSTDKPPLPGKFVLERAGENLILPDRCDRRPFGDAHVHEHGKRGSEAHGDSPN